MAGVVSPSLTYFSNGFLNNVLLKFFSFITKENGWYGFFISSQSINKANGTESITWSWLPRSFSVEWFLSHYFCPSFSQLLIFNGTRKSMWMKQWFTFQAATFLLEVAFSFNVVFCANFFLPFVNFIIIMWTANNTKIYFWYDEKYVLKTVMI